jgi:hypothetical protein
LLDLHAAASLLAAIQVEMSNSFPMGSVLPKMTSKIAYGHLGHLGFT